MVCKIVYQTSAVFTQRHLEKTLGTIPSDTNTNLECLNAYEIVHKNDRVILPYNSFASVPLHDHDNDSRAIQHTCPSGLFWSVFSFAGRL